MGIAHLKLMLIDGLQKNDSLIIRGNNIVQKKSPFYPKEPKQLA
jgi:hypothetical protein